MDIRNEHYGRLRQLAVRFARKKKHLNDELCEDFAQFFCLRVYISPRVMYEDLELWHVYVDYLRHLNGSRATKRSKSNRNIYKQDVKELMMNEQSHSNPGHLIDLKFANKVLLKFAKDKKEKIVMMLHSLGCLPHEIEYLTKIKADASRYIVRKVQLLARQSKMIR